MKKYIITLSFLLIIIQTVTFSMDSAIMQKSIVFFDKNRSRSIPIEIYGSETIENSKKIPIVAIISHGYTVKNTEYSFIANILAHQGYLVVSIQHDLEGDLPLPVTGNLFERRKPLWERGAQNILFVISELKQIYPRLKFDKVALIGHSNGGDISMLFTSLYPKLVLKVVSLDSLRYPFPTKDHVPILTLRSSDKEADKGVLPESGAEIILLADTKHENMCDRGLEKVKKEIIDLISKYLR